MSREANGTGFFSHPFGVQWRKALVSAPRLLPDAILRLTSPDGPHPFVVKIPAREPAKKLHDSDIKDVHGAAKVAAGLLGKRTIAAYAFVPDTLQRRPSIDDQPVALPVLLDFHGGGFVLGSCHEQAPWCASVARKLGALVLSVDYRMGPASQFPAAIHDAEDVLRAVIDPSYPGYASLRDQLTIIPIERSLPPVTIDVDRIAFSGFSSGANLALNLVLSLTDCASIDDAAVSADNPSLSGSSPPAAAWPSMIPSTFPTKIPTLLFYPSLDCRLLPSERPIPASMPTSSSSSWSKTLLKSLDLETSLQPTYLPRQHAAHHRASPGLAPLTGLHPQARMLLVLPEWDSLAEQSRVWVDRVRREGGDVVASRLGGDSGRVAGIVPVRDLPDIQNPEQHARGTAAEGAVKGPNTKQEDVASPDADADALLTVRKVPRVVHGWTQFPDSWLAERDREFKEAVFREARDFLNRSWAR